MIEIKKVTTNKKQYLPLLLLADEQEDMIDRYLERGTMYILDDNGVKGVCVVTDEGDGILEIKNIPPERLWQNADQVYRGNLPQSVFHPPGWYRRQSAYHSIL